MVAVPLPSHQAKKEFPVTKRQVSGLVLRLGVGA
ncbi:hypothetical protein FHR32_006101 [Streptosporangium album]|uniref:Uncharacterized protein n=1 Tax=Streptosporangium album TaxID=47479 RepID=A0A7W7S0M2_9ACTN|nr:hypothetical protein [Streptosporangium album]